MKALVILVLVFGSVTGVFSRRFPGCPKNKPMVYCFVDPCRFATCEAYPDATCRGNYCGGCNAEWYEGGKKVDCDSFPCPKGVPVVNCFADPCQVTSCPAYPDAKCRSNFCGGCNADWFVGGKPVDCSIGNRCPPGVPVVQCRDNPCRLARCPNFPGATCKANYCGGCNAEWFVGRQQVQCTLH